LGLLFEAIALGLLGSSARGVGGQLGFDGGQVLQAARFHHGRTCVMALN
jgi:hypothetical protein